MKLIITNAGAETYLQKQSKLLKRNDSPNNKLYKQVYFIKHFTDQLKIFNIVSVYKKKTGMTKLIIKNLICCHLFQKYLKRFLLSS